MKLIGLAGKARSGKSTVANILQDIIGSRAVYRYAFADPIRKAAAEIFGLPLMVFAGDYKDKEKVIEGVGFSPRQILQLLGTECGRNVFRQDIWLLRAKAELAMKKSYNGSAAGSDTPLKLFLVEDIRFENEAAWIRSEGGKVFHIERNVEIEDSGHSSEAGVIVSPLEDRIITNVGTLAELEGKVRDLCNLIGVGEVANLIFPSDTNQQLFIQQVKERFPDIELEILPDKISIENYEDAIEVIADLVFDLNGFVEYASSENRS